MDYKEKLIYSDIRQFLTELEHHVFDNTDNVDVAYDFYELYEASINLSNALKRYFRKHKYEDIPSVRDITHFRRI